MDSGDSKLTVDDYFQNQMKDQSRKNSLITKDDRGMVKFIAKRIEPEENMKLVKQLDPNSFEEFGFGCILGNFLADAIGAKDEFASDILKES